MFDGIRNALEFLRFLCLCVVFERGSWSPPKPKISTITTTTATTKKQETKPEWLKEWTISKGWIHNRTHLLTLGKQQMEETSDSSISSDNIDELVSNDENSEDFSLIFQQISENYRENFPEMPTTTPKRQETLKEQSMLVEFWRKFKRKQGNSRKFKVTQLDRKLDSLPSKVVKNRTNLGRNIALYNTLNSKTNLHEEPIYECSEENLSIYNNPIYSPLKYYDFHSNNLCRNKFQLNNNRWKTEKYIIRHIKIRIMLSLRIGRFKKRYKQFVSTTISRTSPVMSSLISNGNRNLIDGRETIRRAHEEQRRIGNGTTSIKIQNMRYGRLNVLRWLLWEAEFQQIPSNNSNTKKMPALERPIDNTTLALHYAAARGCLDCVRLLVDSTPDLSANTQMDNDVTPVYLAAQEGHLDVLKFLVLEAGGSLYVRAKDGMAPIHAASQMGCLNCVKWMIQEQGVDPNLRDGDGATPLHFAASRGHLETVRWLLKHGARLSLDKYGKSPINDAAENQQVECLNVLVQHGTTPDYNKGSKSCSCTRKSEQLKRENSISSDCSGCKPKNPSNNNNNNSMEPFYLHPPLGARQQMEAAHAPQDGLYINPMNTSHKHSASNTSESSSNDSVNGESFYLHNPQEVIYNRVKDLFETQPQRQPLSALTVKVEVHSSSSGAGSDENLSSSDLSEQSIDHDHDYEDIYLVRAENKQQESSITKTPTTTTTITKKQERSRSRDSGSHSRSNSTSSSNSGCNLIVKVTPTKSKTTSQKKDDTQTEQQQQDTENEYKDEKTRLGPRNSAPPVKASANKILKRATSTPGDICAPPPPPPPLPLNNNNNNTRKITPSEDDEPRGAEIVEIVEEPTLKPSEIAKGACRTMSALTTSRRLNSSCSDLTIVSLTTDIDDSNSDKNGPSLINKQRVLPFIPPNFANTLTNSNNLIKPSEYLRSINNNSDKRASISSTEEVTMVMVDDKKDLSNGPPPPPLPEMFDDQQQQQKIDVKKQQQHQPLSAISIQDLNSVQLRRTNEKLLATKTLSAPPTRSLSLQCLQSNDSYKIQKIDLIAELKLSKDITGIKKMKIERAKVEETKEKQLYTEMSKQFTATKFVEKVIPDKDNTGNIIPAWKRQMLAKKAAERARKELEEQIQREAEEKRLQSIPQWKRQLMAKKEETENRIRSTLYTPKVIDDGKTIKVQEAHNCLTKQHQQSNDDYKNEDINNNNSDDDDNNNKNEMKEERQEEQEDVANIIPWRAQLRKTNSKLNLLD